MRVEKLEGLIKYYDKKEKENKIKIGHYAKHIKDGYIGKIVDFDNVFVKLDNGKNALRCYIKTSPNKEDLM